MKDQVFRVEYFVLSVDDRVGEVADLGRKLSQEGVNLLAISVFPTEGGHGQVDLVPEHPEKLTKAARKLGLVLQEPRITFLVQGTDRAGAIGEVLARLSGGGVNMRATLGVGAGGNRYAALIWVAQEDVEKATRLLGATALATHHA
jgi:hypothetical protein